MKKVVMCEKDPSWSYWSHRWATKDTPWHNSTPHPFLDQLSHRLLDHRGTAFVPLCGKATELKWFFDQGYNVVGVEYVETTGREFFSEWGMPMETSTCPNLGCRILQTPDKRLRIFCCSIFDFNRYATIVKSLMAPTCRYLLVSCIHQDETYSGFPVHTPDDVVQKLFGDCKTEKISHAPLENPCYIITPRYEVRWLITPV
ncbi:thiopurine S-methyltransferase-like isoform X2 [Ornithodoros turicata]|uniref:thiopurine S-methyltransferase-like isoform X2 n=1 Tax=Ornithodoros turicata TaxID=34597 RepID=UPI003138A961